MEAKNKTMDPIKARFVISGNVQDVNCRVLVKNIAKRLKIRGYVRNLDDGTIEGFCEGDREAIENLKKAIESIKPKESEWFGLKIEKIGLFFEGGPNYKEPGKEFKPVFYIDYRDEDLQKTSVERLEIGSLLMLNLISRVDTLGIKTDQFRTETNQNFASMAEKYGEIGKEMKSLREDVKQSNENNAKLIKTLIEIVKSKK